ncbi:hypothetical protein NA57DRAFT_56673 [Rhizodiscina lignyota]|uniref:PHD-type domain-containing protein n=1 Tax=Rhizodiscina lignyota TaxID=1504668 RepID=A0A9P4M6B1_9PEZI|nr:hypothetical protein NA57DRAFT_56673 [Rhizodiscina lignyota]
MPPKQKQHPSARGIVPVKPWLSAGSSSKEEECQIDLEPGDVALQIQLPSGTASPTPSQQKAAACFAGLPAEVQLALQHDSADELNRALVRLSIKQVETLLVAMMEVEILLIRWAGNLLNVEDVPMVLVRKERWCVCRGSEDEDIGMICCDEARCKIHWFHYGCVGLTEEPGKSNVPKGKAKWLCDACKAMGDRQWRERSA